MRTCSPALCTIFSNSNCQSGRKSWNFNFCPQLPNGVLPICRILYVSAELQRKSTFVGLSLVLLRQRYTWDTADGTPGTPLRHTWAFIAEWWCVTGRSEVELSWTSLSWNSMWTSPADAMHDKMADKVTGNHMLMGTKQEAQGYIWQVLSWV